MAVDKVKFFWGLLQFYALEGLFLHIEARKFQIGTHWKTHWKRNSLRNQNISRIFLMGDARDYAFVKQCLEQLNALTLLQIGVDLIYDLIVHFCDSQSLTFDLKIGAFDTQVFSNLCCIETVFWMLS